MTAAGTVRDVPVTAQPREWWQVFAERRARWWERHLRLRRRLSVVRTAGLWVGLCYLLVVAVAWPELLLGMKAWVGACLGAVVWFFLARTKTLTWSGFMRFFAVCGVWSVVTALVLARVSSTLGNAGIEALGPTVFVAGLGEEALKLLPLLVLAMAAPRRVSRFASVDWWLLGLGAGLAFELVEEGARRVFLLAEMQRQGLLTEYQELYGAGVPDEMTTFGLLPSDWSHEGAGFAGHAVSTGIVAALVGLAVVVWRWSRGRGLVGWAWRAMAAVVPVVCLVTMMADHLVFNALGDEQVVADDGAWLDGQVSAVPWWLRVPWQVFGHGHYRVAWFVLLFVVCLVVDGYRLGARPASSLAGQPLPPGLGGALARLWVLPGRWARVWAVVATAVLVTGYVVVRDLGQVAAAHVRGAGEPVRAAMRRGAVAASTARGLRETAMEHAAGPVRPTRTRLLAVLLAAGLLVVALWVAPYLAAGTGEGLLRPDTGWLPGVLESLAEYWNSLPLARQIGIEIALGAMLALMMGPIGWGVAGVLTWGLAHGAGIATFARDPRAATADYLANLTPAQAGADLLDAALTFAPGGFATGGRAVARDIAHHATVDPVAVVVTRRQLIDQGLPAHPGTPSQAPVHGPHPGTTASSAHQAVPSSPQAPSYQRAPSSPTAHPANPAATPHAAPAPHPTSPATGPAHPQAGLTPSSPTSLGHASPGSPTPGTVHPSTGLPAHPAASPQAAHPPAKPTDLHPQTASAQPRLPHQPSSPAPRPDAVSAQPGAQPRPAPHGPTRPADPPGPRMPTTTPGEHRSELHGSAASAGPVGRTAPGHLPGDSVGPPPSADVPARRLQAGEASASSGSTAAGRSDVAALGSTADHFATQRVPGMPRSGEPDAIPSSVVQPTPEAAAVVSRGSGATAPTRPASTNLTEPARRTGTPGTARPSATRYPADSLTTQEVPGLARPGEPVRTEADNLPVNREANDPGGASRRDEAGRRSPEYASRGDSQDAPGGQVGPGVSLDTVRQRLGRAGMSIRGYDIGHTPTIEVEGRHIFGRTSYVDGEAAIEISDIGLADMDEAVVTVFHEIHHVDSWKAFGHPGSEAAAENFGESMLAEFKRRAGR